VLGLLLWLWGGGTVRQQRRLPRSQQFIEQHLQGRFAEARGFTYRTGTPQWLALQRLAFGAHGVRWAADDLSELLQFAQAFRSNIIGTTPYGDNQVSVTVVRTSKSGAFYTWAIVPKQGATPYALIEA
jgi:hypothetical protein